MGNASTKERSISPPHGGHHNYSSTNLSRRGRQNRDEDNGGPSSSASQGRMSTPLLGEESYSTRSRSRHNLESTLFGLGVGSREQRERDREAERESREQRKAEKEKERLKERERSMREESVDGGLLVTQGVYTGVEDFKDRIVRHLMIDRRLAPFFKGLPDHESSWTDAQLVAAVKGLPIPPAHQEPRVEDSSRFLAPQRSSSNEVNLTVPIALRSRAQSCSSDVSNRSASSLTPTFGFSSNRARSKTMSISSPRNPTLTAVAGPVETNNPSKTVDGRPIEAVLYKDAIECPICFLYYPPYLNKTRCCDQEICSECFVQIKRADPHLPEHHDGDNSGIAVNADQLISEPATCPFCVEPNFGVTYTPPPFRRGLIYANSTSNAVASGATNTNASSTSLLAAPTTAATGKRRSIVPASSPDVVTTDQIRPDWVQKLAAARSHAARRAAAATALHTAAYLMGSHSAGSGSGSGSGSGGAFSTRRLMRRAVREGGGSGGSETPSPAHSGTGTPRGDGGSQAFGGLTSLASFTERNGGAGSSRSGPSTEERLAALGLPLGSFGPSSNSGGGSGLLGIPSGGPGNRRSRMVDLEEMMLMEAIRLSLAEEEERKKREEKEAKRKEKEEKEKEKAAKRGSSLFSFSSSGSGSAAVEGKGKSVDRTNFARPSGYPGPSSASSLAVASTSSLQIPTVASSSDSSSFASFQRESGDEERRSMEETGGENACSGLESMFNFRSLAEMIVEEEGNNGGAKNFEREQSSHVEDVGKSAIEERIAPVTESPRTGEPELVTRQVVLSPELEDKQLEVTAENLRSEQMA
ncbi:SNF1-interacting protein [Rhizina undulata]